MTIIIVSFFNLICKNTVSSISFENINLSSIRIAYSHFFGTEEKINKTQGQHSVKFSGERKLAKEYKNLEAYFK
jgi:hypothetical protein